MLLLLQDPIPPAKWEDIYDATEEKPGCYELNSLLKRIIGTEDGLILNIYSKNLSPDKSKPVLIYIHGGAFQTGSSSTKVYSPDYLLMADVVVVTINYRLGALGFLSLKDKELNVPGNAGLKDQRLAMKFVKNNIRNFGGDPDNITLFGQSAGGSSVSWHCVSEGSKGLFHKAIIMSGCVLNNWSLTPHKNWAYRLAKKIGYSGSENEGEILKFLQQADPTEIVEFQKTLIERDERVGFSFAPTVEQYTTEETFIAKPPLELLKSAWSNDIDILIGGTSDEGLMYLENLRETPALLEHFKLENAVPVEINSRPDSPKVIEFVESLKKYYYPTSKDPTKDELAFCKVCPSDSLFIINEINHFLPFSLLPFTFQIKTDQIFWHGLQRLVQGRQNYGGKGKTYLYRFAVDSPTQNHFRIRKLGPNVRGVCHADEISYFFKNIFGDVPEQSSLEFKSIQRFVSFSVYSTIDVIHAPDF